MMRMIVRVKDRKRIDELEKFGSILFKSPVLNIATLEIRNEFLIRLQNDDNVISCNPEPIGKLMAN